MAPLNWQRQPEWGWRDLTSFKNLLNIADDSKVTGSTAKKVIQAFGHDAQAIGDNVKIAKKHKLLLEGIVPKLSESASGKVIAKKYAKETLKQATFAEIKDAVVAPAANTITSSVVGNDTSSIEYKITNKLIGFNCCVHFYFKKRTAFPVHTKLIALFNVNLFCDLTAI